MHESLSFLSEVVGRDTDVAKLSREELLDLALDARDLRPGTPSVMRALAELEAVDLNVVVAGAEGVLGQEDVVPENPELPIVTQLDPLARMVCNIRVEGQDSHGTGFLVAPDLVMTASHVINSLITGRFPYVCTFDYVSINGRRRRPIRCGLAAAPIVFNGRANKVKTSPQSLDFAILRLDRTIGGENFPGTANRRGWVDLTKEPPHFAIDDAVFVMQHSAGAPLRYTTGPIRTHPDATRVRYAATTFDATSGSPVFNASQRILAVHTDGDLDTTDTVILNEGVLISAILNVLPGNVAALLPPLP